MGFLAITCIAVFLLEKDYTRFVEWVKGEKSFRFLWTVLGGVLTYLVTFFKAQGVILLIIGALCGVTLGIAGVEGGIFLGILAGLLDMLPFVGTGIVLVPLSAWRLLAATMYGWPFAWGFMESVYSQGNCSNQGLSVIKSE